MPVDRYDETISEQIERMRAEMRVDSDAELARELNIDPSAISAWRRRRSIPKKYLVRFHRILNEYADFGRGLPNVSKLREAYIFSLICIFSDKIKSMVTLLVDEDQQALWIGYQARRVYNFLDSEFRKIDPSDKDELRKKYEYFEGVISNEKLPTWIETLPDW